MEEWKGFSSVDHVRSRGTNSFSPEGEGSATRAASSPLAVGTSTQLCEDSPKDLDFSLILSLGEYGGRSGKLISEVQEVKVERRKGVEVPNNYHKVGQTWPTQETSLSQKGLDGHSSTKRPTYKTAKMRGCSPRSVVGSLLKEVDRPGSKATDFSGPVLARGEGRLPPDVSRWWSHCQASGNDGVNGEGRSVKGMKMMLKMKEVVMMAKMK
ncbi:hypothetical protein Dimus_015907 [Dionaea muscipula]